jgi:hypothetical protein
VWKFSVIYESGHLVIKPRENRHGSQTHYYKYVENELNHRYISFALSTYAFSSYFNIHVYAKRDDFSFPIINFPFLNGDVALTSLYVAYIPRLVRFQRICNNVSDFHDDFLVVLWQGDRFHRLQKTFTRQGNVTIQKRKIDYRKRKIVSLGVNVYVKVAWKCICWQCKANIPMIY